MLMFVIHKEKMINSMYYFNLKFKINCLWALVTFIKINYVEPLFTE